MRPLAPAERDLLRAGHLKRRLLDFVLEDDCLGAALRHRLARQGIRHLDLAEGETQLLVDGFLLEHRLEDGRTPVERFADAARWLRPRDRVMLRRWTDVVTGVFAIRAREAGGIVLENLVDELTYRTYSNRGYAFAAEVPEAGFLLGRLVPFGQDWLLSGEASILPPAARDRAVQAAAYLAREDPRLVLRNPRHLEEARGVQRRYHEAFVAFFGTDTVVLPGRHLSERMDAYLRFFTDEFRGPDGLTAAERGRQHGGVTGKRHIPLTRDLTSAEAVAVLSDEAEGIQFFLGFDRLLALVEDPALADDPAHREVLLAHLQDPEIEPLVLQRLARDHPAGLNAAVERVLGWRGFSWERHGDDLLRRYKAACLSRPRLPHVVPLPTHLVSTVDRVPRNAPCPCGSGRKFKRCCGA